MSHETLTVIASNTQFATLFEDDASMDLLLGAGPTVVGFTEASPGRREQAVAAIEVRDYQAIVPEGTLLDTLWAVSPDLTVISSEPIQFGDHRMQRWLSKTAMGGGKRRTVGVHGLTVKTPGGQSVRFSNSHPSPPVLEFLRRPQMRTIDEVLAGHPYFSQDGDVIDIDMGDKNHYPGPNKATRAWYERMGFTALLAAGTGTCNIAITHRIPAKIMSILGMPTHPQLDAIYVRPSKEQLVVSCSDILGAMTLAANELGHQTAVHTVASDHGAVISKLFLPQRQAVIPQQTSLVARPVFVRAAEQDSEKTATAPVAQREAPEQL